MSHTQVISKTLNGEAKMKFVGSAQKECAIFDDLVLASLDKTLPNWNDSRSYMIPPIFCFKNPSLPDHSVKILNESTVKPDATNRLAIDRASDDAEYVVFKALQTLLDEQYCSPFIVLHSLNVNPILKELKSLYPELDSSEIGASLDKGGLEYDYIVIGPKVGIVVIEIKGSSFTQSKHFSAKGRYLPEVYLRGLKHLDSTERLLELLKMLSNTMGFTDYEAPAIRKVLFTPNLKRLRFEGWFNGLQDVDKEKIQGMIGSDVVLWFEEDMENTELIEADSSTGQPPPLYSSLRNLLSTSRPLPMKLYESFVPIMIGMHSAIVRQAPMEKAIIEPNGAKAKYSELDPAESPTEILKIQQTQNGKGKRPHDWAMFSHQRNNLGSSGSFYLTHDQALTLVDGSARKLIIGTAGTGKTTVLQARALELMRQGQPIVVFASPITLGMYQRVFMDNGLTTGYRLEPWQITNDRLFQNLHIANKSAQTSDFARWARDQLLEAAHQAFEDPVQYAFFDQFIRSKEDSLMTAMDEIDRRLRFLVKDCHVFIDDAVEMGDCNEYAAILALLAFAHVECHSGRLDRSIWASSDPTNVQRALDTTQVSKEDFARRWTGQILPGDLVRPIVEKIMRNFMDQREEEVDENRYTPISVNHLRRIVRSTENIYQHAYGLTDWLEKPTLSHKIIGPPVSCTSVGEYPSLFLALERLSREIDPILKRLLDEGIHFDQRMAAIVYQSDPDWARTVEGFLLDCVLVYWKVTHGSKMQIFNSTQVSSLEWPVVLYVEVLPEGFDEQSKKFGRYRARTRSTLKLIEIRASYGGGEKLVG